MSRVRGICHYSGTWNDNQFYSVQLLSLVWHLMTPWTAVHQASLSITNSQSLLKLMSIKSVMPSNRLILCRPLLLLPSLFPNIRAFSKESALCIRWPKYLSFSLSINPPNEYSGLISFTTDWSPCSPRDSQESSPTTQFKSNIFWHSAFFTAQLSHLYVTTGKTIALTIALTIWTFVGKVMSLLFNMLCRFVIAFLPSSKCLLISWLQSPSAVILEPKKVKSVTSPTFFPFCLPWNGGTRCHYLSSFNIEFKARFFTLFHCPQEAIIG